MKVFPLYVGTHNGDSEHSLFLRFCAIIKNSFMSMHRQSSRAVESERRNGKSEKAYNIFAECKDCHYVHCHTDYIYIQASSLQDEVLLKDMTSLKQASETRLKMLVT